MIRKKGQTEDFIADLIPSLIIIAIGLYVLSDMQDVGKKATENTNIKLVEELEGRKTLVNYLTKEIELDDKKITLNELISLGYKNEEYQRRLIENLQRTGLAQLKIPIETIAESTEQLEAENIQTEVKECLKLDIKYPDGSNLEIGEKCMGREKVFALPTYEGQYLTVKLTVRTTRG